MQNFKRKKKKKEKSLRQTFIVKGSLLFNLQEMLKCPLGIISVMIQKGLSYFILFIYFLENANYYFIIVLHEEYCMNFTW